MARIIELWQIFHRRVQPPEVIQPPKRRNRTKADRESLARN
jgi:hypothetical protein